MSTLYYPLRDNAELITGIPEQHNPGQCDPGTQVSVTWDPGQCDPLIRKDKKSKSLKTRAKPDRGKQLEKKVECADTDFIKRMAGGIMRNIREQ